jgi:hypothetical protein
MTASRRQPARVRSSPSESLRIDVGELLNRVEAHVGRELRVDERTLLEQHVMATLVASTREVPPAQGLERRVGPGRYLGISDLTALGVTVVLGPVVHLLATGSAVFSLRRLIRFDSGWRPRLVAIYAQLSGAEREVFEAVHHLHSEWIVANYDALRSHDPASAYARVAPTLREVSTLISADSPPSDVAEAANRLVTRRILATDGERYWIRL